MSSNDFEENVLSPRSIEDNASPRKRMRLDNSANKKSWSFIEGTPDQEVLQEMGVSILDPDEGDSGDSLLGTMGVQNKPLKRKQDFDIENVNPNIKLTNIISVKSPRTKLSPKSSPKSPIPGPSNERSPCPIPGPSNERSPLHKPLKEIQLTNNEPTLETILEEYQIDQETPLAQILLSGYSGHNARKRPATPLGLQEELIMSRRTKSEPVGMDTFAVLSDEIVLSVFKWLPKRTLAHCTTVCKRWHRISCDETLWQRLDLGNKSLNPGALGRILSRKPIIVRLANSEIGVWHPTQVIEPSRIQYLDLSMASIDLDTLDHLLARCPMLKKLSLESVVLREHTLKLVGKCSNLETLNLAMASGVTEDGLAAILEGCTSLQALNISWCNLSEDSLHMLVNNPPSQLQRLNIAGARSADSDMIETLVERSPRLIELDLSDCSNLEASGLNKVHELTMLEHLALSRCYRLPPHCLTKLSSMPSLQYLEVWGMLQTASLTALKAALPAIHINRFMFSAIARPTVGTRRTSIWGLRTRD